jgi:hypothetical protein
MRGAACERPVVVLTKVGDLELSDPVPILTVGDLKIELSRWADDTPITFRCPLRDQEFRFYRYHPDDNALAIEINEYPETPQVLPKP